MTTNSTLLRLLLLIALAAAGTHSYAQISSASTDRHSIIGARGSAMGDANIAEPFDAMVLYWNPAALVRILHPTLIANFSVELNDYEDQFLTENVTLPLPLLRDWGLGAGLTLTHLAKTTDESPFRGLNFSIFKMDLAGSRALGNSFSLGGGLIMRYAQGAGEKITTFAGSVGLLYVPNPNVSYGFSLQGLGDGVDFNTESGSASLVKTSGPKSAQIGATIRTHDPQYSRFTLSIAAEKLIDSTGLVYKGGIEALPFTFLVLRIGYWVGPDTRAARYGVGLILGDFLLDYTVAPSHLEPRFHQVSLSYDLQRRTGKR